MKIRKIFNNNVVVSKNELDEEIIVTGKGIGYKKKQNDEIDEKIIEKIFKLDSKNSFYKIEHLLKNIDLDFFKITDEIIAYANQKILLTKNDLFYFVLADHISAVIQRIEKGLVINNTLLHEIKSFYPVEYEIGVFALSVVYKYTRLQLQDDEAGFIAFHFINNNVDSSMPIATKILKVIEEILDIIKIDFKIIFDEQSFYYFRFLTHLKFFATRVLLKQPIQKAELSEMQEVIFEKYPKIYACVSKISQFITKTYEYNVSQDEQLYLSIHLTTIMKIMKGGI